MLTAPQDAAHTRLCIINKNNPGVLGEITTLLGSHGVNIAQQLNTSREGIAYNVIDMQVWYGYRESRENSQNIVWVSHVAEIAEAWRCDRRPSHRSTRTRTRPHKVCRSRSLVSPM